MTMKYTKSSCKDIRSKVHNAQLTAGAIFVIIWLVLILAFVLLILKFSPEIENVGSPTGLFAGVLLLIEPFIVNDIVKHKFIKLYPQESSTIKESLSLKSSFIPQAFIAIGLIIISIVFWFI